MEKREVSEARELYLRISDTLLDESLIKQVKQVLFQLNRDPELQEELMDEVVTVIEDTVNHLEPIEDAIELVGILTVRYARIKADWVLLNTKTQYIKDRKSRDYYKTSYLSSILTVILVYIEPFIDDESKRVISEMLLEPIAILKNEK
jgi:hypothetical protein